MADRPEYRVRLRLTDDGHWPPPVGAEVTVAWRQDLPVVGSGHAVPVEVRCAATVTAVDPVPVLR